MSHLDGNKSRMLILDKMDTHKPIHVMDGVLENHKFIYTADEALYEGGGTLSEDMFKGYYKGSVDNYKKETIRVSDWFVEGVIKYHRTIETYLNELIDAGFSIKRLLEPGPTVNSIAERPGLSEHLRRPPILVLSGVKKTGKCSGRKKPRCRFSRLL